MKIKAIHLSNFGSYEGSNTISFENSDSEKRVVVIGGKNGAGKRKQCLCGSDGY